MFLGEQNSYLILNGSLVYSLTWGAAPDVKRYCQSKLTWDGQGHFVPQSNNKTLPIPLRKICPKVTAPYCLGPWTGNQEPRTVGIGSRTHVLLIALLRHSWRWMLLLGPRSVDQRQGLLCLIAKVEPYDLGTGTPNFRVPRLGPRALVLEA